MKKSTIIRKRAILAALVTAATLTVTSCFKDGDFEFLHHPIHVVGNISPNYAFPLGTGEFSFDDLISNLSADFTGYIDPNAEVLTIMWDGDYSDTIFPLSDIPNLDITKRRHTATKDETYLFHKDTIISQSIDIPIFDNADFDNLANSIMEIKELWVSLSVAAKGEPAMVARHVEASFSELKVNYIDRNGVEQPFDPGSNVDSVAIENLHQGIHKQYDSINLAPIVNSYPRHIDVSFRLRLNVHSDIQYLDWENWGFREMLDSIQMTRLIYSVGASLRVPFDIKVGDFSYTYDLDLGDSIPKLNLDSLTRSIDEGFSGRLDSVRLNFDFANRIPLNLNIDASMLDQDGNTIISLFRNRAIRHGKLHEMQPPYRGSHTAYDTTLSSIPFVLTGNDLDNFHRARTLRIKAGLGTNNQYVVIRREDFLRIRASLQLAVGANFNIAVTDRGIIK